MREMGVGAPPSRGGGHGSVWFAIAAATGGLVAAIGTSVVAHDRAIESEPPKVDPRGSAVPERAGIESATVRPDASPALLETERADVTRAR